MRWVFLLFLTACTSCPPCPDVNYEPCLSLIGSFNREFGARSRELDSLKQLIATGRLVSVDNAAK